jgi:hypothetical protein
VILIGLLFGLSSISDAALLCWNDEISLRCDITPDDWDTETERHYMEERESDRCDSGLFSFPSTGP